MNDSTPAQDGLLTEAAGALLAVNEDDAANALIASDLAVQFGTSWWDGHDDYIYDVMIVISTPADAEHHLRVAEGALRRALGAAVAHFRDQRGEWRRGDLVQLDVVTGAVDVDELRRRRRQDDAAKHAAARRRR